MAGRSKTRLAKETGVVQATAFARHAGMAVMRRLSRDPRWQSLLAVTPDTALKLPIWPAALGRLAQGRGDLGQRMQRLFSRLPPGPVLLVGTDIPRITACHIAQAFRLLGNSDAVLGPAGDGGYWLVGLRRRPHLLKPFAKVRFSGPHALTDTVANIAPWTVGVAATLHDVDDALSLRRDAAVSGRVVLPR